VTRKNPYVTALLNFFLGGIGFAYLGTAPLAALGVFWFCFTILSSFIVVQVTTVYNYWWVLVASIVEQVLIAIVGFLMTQHINKVVNLVEWQASIESPGMCKTCGEKNVENARYCSKCGAKIS
jgi:hypothetical protein